MKQTNSTKRTNRFFARSAKRAALAKRSPRVAVAAPEIDALESRLLLSGIVEGKDYKKLTYKDLDGDKVTIKMTSGGTFQVAGEFDGKTALSMDQIVITKAGANSVFSIDVAKVKPTADGIGVTAIGELTATGDIDFKSMRLNGANIDSINLTQTDIATSVTLQAKAAIILDRTSAGQSGAVNLLNWGAVNLNSVGTIQSQSVPGTGAGNIPALNFNGPITVNEGAVNIIGRTSNVNGSINVESIGNLNVLNINGAVTTVGDLTLNLANGQSISGANINVGGDLHLGVLSGGLGSVYSGTTTFNVVGSISGADASSTTDAVNINGEVYDVTFNAGTGGTGAFAGLTVVGGNIAATNINTPDTIGDITAKQGGAALNLAADSIGDITVRDALTLQGGAGNGLVATKGDIGAISAGNIFGAGGSEIIASGSVGTITTTKGDLNANVTAGSAIGNITSAGDVANLVAGTNVDLVNKVAATGGNIGSITAAGNIGAITAFNGSIGDITTTDGSLGNVVAGTANNAQFAATGGDVGKITVTGGDVNAITVHKGGLGDITVVDGTLNGVIAVGSAKVGTFAQVGGNIGNISVTTDKLVGGNSAIGNAITALNGSIGNVTATALGANDIALDANLTALTTIGNIEAKATGTAGIGIDGGLTIAAAKIGNVTALGTVSAPAAVDAIAIDGALTLGVNTLDTGTTSVGNVSITGSVGGTLNVVGIGSVTAPAVNGGATVGNITMVANSANNPLNVSLTDVRTVGNISLTGGIGDLDINSAKSGATGVDLITVGSITAGNGLDVSGIANLDAKGATLGNVQVAGAITVGAALGNAKTIGTFSAGDFVDNASGGNLGIGKAGLAGSIGNVTISSTQGGANNYVFTFNAFGTVTAAGGATVGGGALGGYQFIQA